MLLTPYFANFRKKKGGGGQIDPHRRSRGVAFSRRSSVKLQINTKVFSLHFTELLSKINTGR